MSYTEIPFGLRERRPLVEYFLIPVVHLVKVIETVALHPPSLKARIYNTRNLFAARITVVAIECLNTSLSSLALSSSPSRHALKDGFQYDLQRAVCWSKRVTEYGLQLSLWYVNVIDCPP